MTKQYYNCTNRNSTVETGKDEDMVVLDLMSRTPIYEQLIEQTEKLILAGVLRAHDKLPICAKKCYTPISMGGTTLSRQLITQIQQLASKQHTKIFITMSHCL